MRPNRPNIRVENDPVKRMRELREFCLQNAPKGFSTWDAPFAITESSWDFGTYWLLPQNKNSTIEIDIHARKRAVYIRWPEEFSNNPPLSRERAALIHDLADFAYALSEFWKDWNTKHWPQKPGRRIVEALAAEGVQNA